MKNYIVSYYSIRSKSDPEYRALMEGLAPDIIWELLDPLCCTMLIQSELDAWELGNKLLKHFDPSDKLLISEVHSNNAWYNLQPDQVGILTTSQKADHNVPSRWCLID